MRDEEITAIRRARRDSSLTTLAICGDPVTGRALTLLLQGSGYKVRFLLATALGEPQALKDVWLLVLTPTPELSTEYRNALLTSLKETLKKGAKMSVLELATPREESQEQEREEETWDESWYTVPWPCRTKVLQRWIEAARSRHYGTRGERIGSATNAL